MPVSHSLAPRAWSLHGSFPAACLSDSLLFSSRSCLRPQLSQHFSASPKSRSMQYVSCQAAFGKHSSLSAMEHPEQSSLSPRVTLHPAATLINSAQTSVYGNQKRNVCEKTAQLSHKCPPSDPMSLDRVLHCY